jgi:hypothetical protein
MWQVGGLVAARAGLGLKVARHQIRRVGLEHEIVRWDHTHERQKMRPAPRIADPAGYADEQLKLQVALKLGSGSREAMRYRAAQLCAMLAQDGDEVRMCIALMQKHGLSCCDGKFKLLLEGLPLRVMRCEIAIVVKATFADRHNLGSMRKLAQCARQIRRPVIGVMRVHACGCKEPPRVGSRELHRLARTVEARAGDDHLHYTGGRRPREHRIAIPCKTIVPKVDADVDERRPLSNDDGA